MTKQMKSNLLLLLTAIIWGSAFVAQKSGMDHIGPYTFNCLRFIIGALTLTPIIIMMDNRQRKKEKSETAESHEELKLKKRSTIMGGFCCGLVIFVGSTLQQVGLVYTDAGKAGFVTALYIVLVPILSLFIKKKPRPIVWFCMLVAAVGLYLLCAPPGQFNLLHFNIGDILILISAFIFAVHILVVDYFSPTSYATKMSCIQFAVCGLVSFLPMILIEHPQLTAIFSAYMPLLYTGVLSCGLAFTLQIIGQKNTDPSTASLIMSLESVFAVIAGILVLHEVLTIREFIGCIVMFTAIILAQLPDKKKEVRDVQAEGA